MAFDKTLAARIREILDRRQGIEAKKMFGGMGFLLDGNMLVGVWKYSLVVRVGAEAYEDALLESFVGEFDITGRPMKGWVVVEPEALDTDEQLEAWIERAWVFVSALPPKR